MPRSQAMKFRNTLALHYQTQHMPILLATGEALYHGSLAQLLP